MKTGINLALISKALGNTWSPYQFFLQPYLADQSKYKYGVSPDGFDLREWIHFFTGADYSKAGGGRIGQHLVGKFSTPGGALVEQLKHAAPAVITASVLSKPAIRFARRMGLARMFNATAKQLGVRSEVKF